MLQRFIQFLFVSLLGKTHHGHDQDWSHRFRDENTKRVFLS